MRKICCFTTTLIFSALIASAQSKNPKDTEVWTPVPKIVTAPVDMQVAPADAIILFEGKNLDEWINV